MQLTLETQEWCSWHKEHRGQKMKTKRPNFPSLKGVEPPFSCRICPSAENKTVTSLPCSVCATNHQYYNNVSLFVLITDLASNRKMKLSDLKKNQKEAGLVLTVWLHFGWIIQTTAGGRHAHTSTGKIMK